MASSVYNTRVGGKGSGVYVQPVSGAASGIVLANGDTVEQEFGATKRQANLSTDLATATYAASGVTGGSLRTAAARAADRPSILEYIPAPYHAAILAGTGTAGTYDAASAINAAVADSACGGLIIPNGMYNFASMATISKPFALLGMGGTYAPPTGTIFRVAQDVIGIKTTNVTDISGIVFDGSAGGPTYDCKGGIGIWFASANKSRLHHCFGCYFRLTPFYVYNLQNSDLQSLGCYYSVYNLLIGGISRNVYLSKSTFSNLSGSDPAYVVSSNPNCRNLMIGKIPSGTILTYLTTTLGLVQLADTGLNYPSLLSADSTIFERMPNDDANVEIRGFYDNIHLKEVEFTDAISGGYLLKTSQPGAQAGNVILRNPTLLTNAAVGSRPDFILAGSNAPVYLQGEVYTNITKPIRGVNINVAPRADDTPPYRHTLGGPARLSLDVGNWVAQAGSITYDSTNKCASITFGSNSVGMQAVGANAYSGSTEFTDKTNIRGRVTIFFAALSANVAIYATRSDTPFQTLIGTYATTDAGTLKTFDYIVGVNTASGGLRLIGTNGATASLVYASNGWLL
jgi:hypothetical protein